tara:strand:+ start:290 stop:532 length:243 start_codon:yes stop_codon:yes gene_type:complete
MDEILSASPESIEELITMMTEKTYKSVKAAVELSKWEDGTRLTKEQVEQCLQILILYEARHLPEDRQVGNNLPSCPSNEN